MIRNVTSVIVAILYISVLQAQNPLIIPPGLTGSSFNLVVAPATKNFRPGPLTPTIGINGNYLGPTVIVNKGDQVTMNVVNQLADTTTMHWHGLHVAPSDDGGPHNLILPATTWSPSFNVLDEAGTFWYHPHLHGKTMAHVNLGAAGLLIVRDSNEATLNLPVSYGIDEFPLIIQDKAFAPNNMIAMAPFGDTMMVNGTLNPGLNVPAQVVRFRVLNASNERTFLLGFDDNRSFNVIGTDGALLNTPVSLNRFMIAPGERADILADFGGQQNTQTILMAYNSQLPPGAPGSPAGPSGPPGGALEGTNFNILQINIQAPSANPVTAIPASLNSLNPFNSSQAVRTRVKRFTTTAQPGVFTINNTPFDMMVMNDTVTLNDIEIWELINNTPSGHPFHIHDIQFFILDINGNPPPPQFSGKKDVVLVLPDDTIRFITKFDDFADPVLPYMFHCHILPHEDAGMMGQFLVVDPAVSLGERAEGQFSIFPNPFRNAISISGETGFESLELFSFTGQLIKTWGSTSAPVVLEVPGLSPGIYFLRTRDQETTNTFRLLKAE